jgi:ABC-type uncharacterized transport system substrate-binding protein
MAESYTRRSFVSLLGRLGCSLPMNGFASIAAPRPHKHIGFFVGSGVPQLVRAFDDEMRRLGYVEGEDISIERRFSGTGSDTTLIAQAAELARMDLDLIVAGALPWALEIRKNNPSMPMVIVTCPGMVSNGFARSLEHPGLIYTGIDELPPGVTVKRLQLLKTAAPHVSRVALLSTTPGTGGHEAQLAEARRVAASLHLTVTPYRATTLGELETALAAIVNDGNDGLATFQGALSINNRQRIVEFAAENRIPAMYQAMMFVEGGGLMAWAPDQAEQFREGARYVDKILKGARPGDLRVRYPPRYYLWINAHAARELGLTLPPSLIAKAPRRAVYHRANDAAVSAEENTARTDCAAVRWRRQLPRPKD